MTKKQYIHKTLGTFLLGAVLANATVTGGTASAQTKKVDEKPKATTATEAYKSVIKNKKDVKVDFKTKLTEMSIEELEKQLDKSEKELIDLEKKHEKLTQEKKAKDTESKKIAKEFAEIAELSKKSKNLEKKAVGTTGGALEKLEKENATVEVKESIKEEAESDLLLEQWEVGSEKKTITQKVAEAKKAVDSKQKELDLVQEELDKKYDEEEASKDDEYTYAWVNSSYRKSI